MSKATSINNLDNVDMNVSQEINNVLAEIETSKNNEIQQQQLPQMIPQQQMPPMQGQQMPPQQVPQYIHHQQQQGMAQPNYYQNFPQPSSGLLDFLKSFLMVGDEIKLVGIITGLFFLMNLSQTKNMLGKYLTFTLNELGESTMIGFVARGLILGLVFVMINKFI